MQIDNLERFVIDNRDEFDSDIPSLKVWAEVDRQLHQPKRKPFRWRGLLQMAAAVLFLLLAGGVAGSFLTQDTGSEASAILQEVNPEFFEMEEYYQVQINQRVQTLASYDPSSTVLSDLQAIDKAMQELREDLEQAPRGKEQEIVENMIRTYQAKLAILEIVLQRMEQNGKTNETLNLESDVSNI